MVDFSAIARWPNVPACYDWLSLDRRGDWRLQGEKVGHAGLIAFMNRQYGSDETGCWFVQNGPQRVFVTLAYTPWIFRRNGAQLLSHTGQPIETVNAVHLDETGSILLAAEPGIGLLDDRDLAQFLGECRDATGQPASEAQLLALMAGDKNAGICWRDIPITPIATVDVEKRYKFVAHPRP